jgi:C-terminal processing protease CtpA/Prc
MKFFVIFIYYIVLAARFPCPALADTVYLHDESEIKGIVVENYHNHIVLSTFEGEKEIAKSDIKDISYDRREQNLLKLGDYHKEKSNARTAYLYYKKAYEVNPNYKEARDKFLNMRSTLLRNPEKQLQSEMTKKQTFFRQSGRIYEPEPQTTYETPENILRKETGISICMDDQMPKILNVVPMSPASQSGIQESDVIFSVWGRLTGYMELGSVIDMIINNPSPEVILTIRREIAVPRGSYGLDNPGISLSIKEEGIEIKEVKSDSAGEKSGLAEGDIITSINGESTRYMPLNMAVLKIEENFLSDKLKFDILRYISLWRKEI